VVDSNPASGITKPSIEIPRERYLSNDEINLLWDALSTEGNVPEPVRTALKLIFLTGMRPGEVIGAKWDQLDGRWLELPSSSTKNNVPHRIFFSDQTLEAIGENQGGFIVPRIGIKRLEVYTLSAWIRSQSYFGLKPWTPHDLRRTCATKLADFGTDPHIISRILNHKPAGITARVYNKHRYEKQIQKALIKLGNSLR
jgi:integrase